MPTFRIQTTKTAVETVLNSAEDLEDLKNGMENWRDSMPESLQNTDKYETVSNIADTLETAESNLEEAFKTILELLSSMEYPDGEDPIDHHILDHNVRVMYKGYSMPRWVQLANYISGIEAMVAYLNTRMEFIKSFLSDTQKEDFDNAMKDIDSSILDLNDISFPSMYG